MDGHTWFGLLRRLRVHRRSRVQSTYPKESWTFSKRHTGERHHSYSKGVTITILGSISDAGVIDISLRKPQAVSTSKKRKVDGKAVDAVNGRIGTRTEHFLAYVSNVMDVLDKNNMQGYYLVMHNAPIHRPAKIRDLVESRHYKCLYLPPYSPFLNPIEEF